MSHLIILTLVLNLIAGTTVFLSTLSVYRRQRRIYLKTLLAYILSFNGLVIIYFIYQYFMINVLAGNTARILDYPILFSVLLLLVYCAEFGMAVSLFRFMMHMQGKKISFTALALFVLWFSLFGGASAYGLDIFFRKKQWTVFYWIHAGWMFSLILIILILLASSLASKAGKDPDRNLRRFFSLLFMIGYIGLGISNLDFYFFHSGIQKYYDPLVILMINLCPLFWLKFFFEKTHRAVETRKREEILEEFCSRYGISKRERDIIEQVMMGKSNKGIEKALFISHNTVKNHLYSIFQKTGVQRRSELIHRISRFGN